MSSSMGRMTSHIIWIKNVPKHQPVIEYQELQPAIIMDYHGLPWITQGLRTAPKCSKGWRTKHHRSQPLSTNMLEEHIQWLAINNKIYTWQVIMDGEQTLFGSTKEHVKVEVPIKGRYNSVQWLGRFFAGNDPTLGARDDPDQGGLLTSFSWSSSRFQRIQEMPTVLLVASTPQKKKALSMSWNNKIHHQQIRQAVELQCRWA